MKLPKSWRIFPCAEKGKNSLVDNFAEKASGNPEQIQRWQQRFPNCNWALHPARSGLVVVDIDRDGLPHWVELCREHGEPETLKAVTGGRGGYHYLFKHDGKSSYKGKLEKGIDIQYNKYILIAPSKVQNPYRWAADSVKHGMQPVPEWLLPLLIKAPRKKSTRAVSQKFDVPFFQGLAEQLAEKDFDYDTWLRLGMALHHASGGSEEGLEIYLQLTQGVNYKPGDEDQASIKWESFSENDEESHVTAGTFLNIARDLKCTIQVGGDPLDYFEDESESPEETPTPGKKSESLPKPNPDAWRVHQDREFTADREELVKRLNFKGYALLEQSKAGRIFQRYHDEHGCLDVTELSNQHFKNSTAHICLQDICLHPKSINYIDSDRVWIQSRNKKMYKKIVFTPNPPKGCLNLWGTNPIPCKRVEGSVHLVLQLIEKIMCNGDTAKANYLLQYFAHIMQKPEKKTAIVPIFIGEEGTGKGCLTNGILGGILKSRYTLVDKRDEIKNKFNKDLAYKFLIVLDEACWRGDNELQAILRSRTGNATVKVEEKFGARYTVEDFARIIISTNTDDPVNLQASNRRYLIFENSKEYKDHAIYDKIWKAIEKDNLCEKFYNYLMEVDISDFNAYKFPTHLDNEGTNAKLGEDIYREFLYDVFTSEPIQLFDEKGLRCKVFYDQFMLFKQSVGTWRKQITPKKFWSEVNKLAPITKTQKKSIRFKVGEPGNGVDCTPFELKQSFWKTLRLGNCQPIADESVYYYEEN